MESFMCATTLRLLRAHTQTHTHTNTHTLEHHQKKSIIHHPAQKTPFESTFSTSVRLPPAGPVKHGNTHILTYTHTHTHIPVVRATL